MPDLRTLPDDLKGADARLADFVDNARRGLEGQALPDPVVDDGGDEYRAAISAELAADRVDEDDAEADPFAEFDPDALANATDWAANEMGFGQRVEPQLTSQDRYFEGLDEADRDAAYAAWHAGLTPAEQAAVRADQAFGLESFAAWLEHAPDNRAQATAAGIPGARVIEDPLHRPLNRFRR